MEEEIVCELHVWHGFNCFPSFPLLRLVLYSFWSLFFRINVMPRRIPDFPDSFHSWNFLSSIGSGITFLSFAMFFSYLSCPGLILSFKDLCSSLKPFNGLLASSFWFTAESSLSLISCLRGWLLSFYYLHLFSFKPLRHRDET